MIALRSGRYDSGLRRRALRKGRERGCSIYIAAEELAKAGYGDGAPAPFYRVWGGERGRLVVQLYRTGERS